MISLTERAGLALSQSLSEEDRITGRIFRLGLLDSATVELQKRVPAHDDETLEHVGYPVLAIPNEIASVVQSLEVDVAPSPGGNGLDLVVKTGEEM